MKKLLVWVGLVVAGTMLLWSLAQLAGAATKPVYDLTVKLADGAVQTVTNRFLNQEVTKFTDGKVICYIVTTKVNTIEANNSISCVK